MFLCKCSFVLPALLVLIHQYLAVKADNTGWYVIVSFLLFIFYLFWFLSSFNVARFWWPWILCSM